MTKSAIFDERTLNINARVSQFALVFTQLGLYAIILYRVYILHQPDETLNDLRILLGLSIFGTMFATLFFGGMLPKITFRSVALIYVGFVALLAIVLSLWLGPPDLSEWWNNILPVVVGPALMLGGYWFFAWLGARRLEKQIGTE